MKPIIGNFLQFYLCGTALRSAELLLFMVLALFMREDIFYVNIRSIAHASLSICVLFIRVLNEACNRKE